MTAPVRTAPVRTAGCAAQGGTPVCEATVASGARVSDFETPGLSFMIEVIEMRPAAQAMVDRIRAARRDRDGAYRVGLLGGLPAVA